MQHVDVSSATPLNSLIARYILDPTLGQTMGKNSKHTGNTYYVVSAFQTNNGKKLTGNFQTI